MTSAAAGPCVQDGHSWSGVLVQLLARRRRSWRRGWCWPIPRLSHGHRAARGDGRLSRDEAPVLLKAQFDRYDTDHDGYITLDDAQGWD
jgi:hypothetical protein